MSYGIVRPSIATPCDPARALKGVNGRYARASGKPGRRSRDGLQGPVTLPSPVRTSRDMAQTMSFYRPRLAIDRKIVKREPIDQGESR